MVVEVESPIGPLKLLGVPYTLSKTPATVRTAPPLHSQHYRELLELAGYDGDEVDGLVERGAVALPTLPPDRKLEDSNR